MNHFHEPDFKDYEEQNSVLQNFYSILQIYVTVWCQIFVIQKQEMFETEIFFLGNIVYNGLFSIKILNTVEEITLCFKNQNLIICLC
jgi:hypothetical protein